MYFSNINDEELQYFKGITAPTFTIKLSDILHKTNNEYDNKLFKIEEILEGNFYKIFPMFNTTRIESSNQNDKILENKCIIAERTEDITRITFIGEENEETEDYIQYGKYFSIGHSLTDAEFNSIIQLIRKNHIIEGDIKIQNGAITGGYGTYTFDIASTTIVDNGILITDETLTNLGTVTLTEPAFHNSTYTLFLTVLIIGDANILDEDEENIIEETIEIELEEGTAVNIPFDTLTNFCIVSFDAKIQIKHDKPIIQIPNGE